MISINPRSDDPSRKATIAWWLLVAVIMTSGVVVPCLFAVTCSETNQCGMRCSAFVRLVDTLMRLCLSDRSEASPASTQWVTLSNLFAHSATTIPADVSCDPRGALRTNAILFGASIDSNRTDTDYCVTPHSRLAAHRLSVRVVVKKISHADKSGV